MDAMVLISIVGIYLFILIQHYKITKQVDIQLKEKTNQTVTIVGIIVLILIEFYLAIPSFLKLLEVTKT